jgi:aminoglycoside phosphotransferase
MPDSGSVGSDRIESDRLAVGGPGLAGLGLAAGARRWRTSGSTVYRFPNGPDGDAEPEALTRFAEQLTAMDRAVPFVVAPVVGSFENWLVVGRPHGQPADRPDLHADPDDLVVAIGRGLRALHDSEPPPPLLRLAEQAPGAGPVADTVLARCSAAVEAGAVATDALPAPYNRYSPEQLLAMFADGETQAADTTAVGPDEPVWCHGSAQVERFVIDGGRFAGFDHMEWPLVADRHFDLASLQCSVQLHFGPEAVFRLYEAYGRDPNLLQLDRHILAVHLLGYGRAEPR